MLARLIAALSIFAPNLLGGLPRSMPVCPLSSGRSVNASLSGPFVADVGLATNWGFAPFGSMRPQPIFGMGFLAGGGCSVFPPFRGDTRLATGFDSFIALALLLCPFELIVVGPFFGAGVGVLAAHTGLRYSGSSSSYAVGVTNIGTSASASSSAELSTSSSSSSSSSSMTAFDRPICFGRALFRRILGKLDCNGTSPGESKPENDGRQRNASSAESPSGFRIFLRVVSAQFRCHADRRT